LKPNKINLFDGNKEREREIFIKDDKAFEIKYQSKSKIIIAKKKKKFFLLLSSSSSSSNRILF
jgi:hypothetical protein